MKKQRGNRKIILFPILLLIVLVTFLSTITVSASWFEEKQIPIPTVRNDVYIYDEANIIDDNIEKQANALLIQLEEQTGAEFAVVTLESLSGQEIEDYANNLANTWGIGKADEDNGVLLLISETDEKVRLEIGRGLEGCLNDSKCGRILDDYFIPHKENNEYSEGTYQTIQAVVSVIAKEYETSIGDIDGSLAQQIEQREEEERERNTKKTIIIAVIVIIVLILDRIFLDGAIFEIALAIIFSGGKSGGKSSGGGFGGGDFNGGGASRG